MPPPTIPHLGGIGTRVSRTLEPDDPELQNKRIRPFRIHELEHIPRDHKDMYAALLRSMPESIFSSGLTKKVSGLIQRYIDVQVDFFFDAIRFYETTRLRKLIPGKTCLIVIGLAPRTEKILVEVDLEFAYLVIAKLLGTSTSGFDVHRQLTEIEQGVFMFIALKVLAEIDKDWPNPEQLSLRIEDFRSDVRSAADILKTEHRWMCASWKISYDMDIGSMRVLLPESLSRAICLTPAPPGSELARRTSQRTWERFAAFADAPVEAWLETGHIELSRSDLEELEPGDIVLLENSQIQLSEGMVTGPAVMRLGLGKIGKISGELRMQDDKQLFEIQEIAIERLPGVHDPMQGHGEAENPEQLVAEYEDHSGHEDYQESHDASGYDYAEEEGEDGDVRMDDIHDEDYGIDDENEGDYEEGDYEEGDYEEGDYEEGDYEEGAYEEGAYEEGAYEEGGHEQGGESEDRFPQAEPLLGDIPMVAVVELGRVQLTADEVVRLRSGQLIEVGRSPTEPVDLVVNGKLVAKGELVEIEGSLGVKLVSLSQGEE